jgi:hypothetical protein
MALKFNLLWNFTPKWDKKNHPKDDFIAKKEK